MSSNLLRLEDCLEDSPQTRALIGVYEDDSDALLTFTQDLSAACHNVAKAQNELALTTQALTHKLRSFKTSSLTGSGDEGMINCAAQKLSTCLDEISSFNTVLYSELSENMEYHSSHFLDKEMTEYLRLKASFHSSDKAHEEACAKLARVSKKAKNEKGWQEATDQLYAARKAFHNTSMLYCCCLNDLQRKKKLGVLKPVVSYLQSQIVFFRMGADMGKPELDNMLKKFNADLEQVEKEVIENRDLYVERMDLLDAESTRAYIPDPPASMDFPDLPVDSGKTQISGYLFSRSRSGILSQWHRHYFFTQGGNLMQQSKKEVAGQLFMDLDGCSVGVADVDDRRNVFQIIAADGKRSMIMQGESKKQTEEWIATIRNISAGLYLEDNPREAIKQARLTSHSEGSTTKRVEEITIDTSKPRPEDSVVSSQAGRARSTSLEKKHESSKLTMFERLKQAATSLITPEEKQTKEQPHKEADPEPIPADASCNYNPHSSIGGASGDSSLEMVLDSTEPVLFDLPSPMPEQKVSAGKIEVAETDDNAQEMASLRVESSEQKRENPFSHADNLSTDDSDASFKAMFIVRFLGCKRISPSVDLDVAIADTIWQVMAARALHKMFRMNELHLMASATALRLVDPSTQLTRESFPVSNVLRAKTHVDNPRLLGFAARHPTTNELLCYTFESNADGGDVCCAINTARAMEQSKVEHEEIKKQREIEEDLEEQSRMISSSASVMQDPDPDASKQKEVI